jgi:hypothetical protein
MAAANYDLYIEQGATFRFTAIYGHKDGTFDVNGNANVIPYDLTGCVARMQIRARRGGDVLISATTTNGGIVFTDAVNGKFTVTITDEATDSLSTGRAKYDLEVGYPSGDVVRVLQGNVRIDPNITQDADLTGISTGQAPARDVNEQQVDVDTLVTQQPSTAGQ